MAAPSRTTVTCIELVQALVQIWLRIVRPVVCLGAGCCVAPSRLWFALPARSGTGKFTDCAGDTGIDLSWKNRTGDAAGDSTTARPNGALILWIRTLSKSAEPLLCRIDMGDERFNDRFPSGAKGLIGRRFFPHLNRNIVTDIEVLNRLHI